MTVTLTGLQVQGYAALKSGADLAPFRFERREPGDHDVLIDILYCGICHTDIHQTRNEWGGSVFPMVPGHEIVGQVVRVGSRVKRFKAGDYAGVGCFVDSCRKCENCKAGREQYCEKETVWTYNGTDARGNTYGGYSSQIVVDENYVLKIPAKQPLDRVAPLLCAGITTYSPLRHWKTSRGQKVGVMGLGGLGHMAVKLAAAMGAEVTVLSRSPKKASDARSLGAHGFVNTKEASGMAAIKNHFDLILDTVSAPHDLNRYLELLTTNGTLVLLGVPPEPSQVEAFQLIGKRRSLAGSMIGGIAETQEMLDFCFEKKTLADVEVIAMKDVNRAYQRMMKSDVHYRFVIDMKSLTDNIG
jgi:alcohol dehydrogenase (NADP+)